MPLASVAAADGMWRDGWRTARQSPYCIMCIHHTCSSDHTFLPLFCYTKHTHSIFGTKAFCVKSCFIHSI